MTISRPKRGAGSLLLALAVSVGCGGGSSRTAAVEAQPGAPAGCQPHIEVHSAAFWATELGESEMWILQHHRINLWERGGSDRGQVIGALRPGARAVILEDSPDAYRVRAPEGAIGWVGKSQVAKTLQQDTESFVSC